VEKATANQMKPTSILALLLVRQDGTGNDQVDPEQDMFGEPSRVKPGLQLKLTTVPESPTLLVAVPFPGTTRLGQVQVALLVQVHVSPTGLQGDAASFQPWQLKPTLQVFLQTQVPEQLVQSEQV